MKTRTDKVAAQLKILVFSTENTPLAARIALALAGVGFHVATLTPRGHPVRQVRKIQHHFTYHTQFHLKSVVRAIDRWSPDLLVCTNDVGVRVLQTLHQQTAAFDDKRGRHISDLIERSLGPSISFPAMRNKSEFLSLAEAEGLRCPRTIVIPAAHAFESPPAELTYPIVVKADQSEGGRCVRIVNRDADLRAALWELQTPSTWRARRFFGAILGWRFLSSLMLPLRRTISLQQHIAGRPANRAVICWNGKVLAGISVEAVEVSHEQGPASVIRLIDHSEMAMVAEHIAKRLHLSGFVGFDFVVDSESRAWLIEMNPRVTPICHFSLADGTDLAQSLYTQMTGQPSPSRRTPIDCDLIALFPDGIIRAPSSNQVLSCDRDVPWDEPELVCRVLNERLRIGFSRRARAFIERYLPAVTGALAGLGLIDARHRANPPP